MSSRFNLLPRRALNAGHGWHAILRLHTCSFLGPLVTDLEFMQLALADARAAFDADEVPIGAILVKDGQILARGNNRTIRDCDPTAHAEIVALRQAALSCANYRLMGSTLYVTIEPCAMCAGAIIQARVSRIVYGADDLKGGAVRSCFEVLSHPKLNHQVQVSAGLMADECAAILHEFFSARR
jgi:tRNA(adenine34) deaminase